MTILYQTTFPTDQDPIGSPFTNFFGSLKVDGGLLQLVAQNTFSVIADTGRTYPSEYTATIVIDTFDNGDFGPSACVSDDGCYFTINVNGTDVWLYKYTGGFTQIGTWADVVYPATGARKVGLKITQVAGDTLIDLVVNDVELGEPVTDTSPFSDSGRAGISGYSGDWRIAGFIAADLNVSTGPTVTGVDDDTPSNGAALTISGSGFLATQGSGGVEIGGVAQTVTSWADDEIVVTVNRGTNKYGVTLDIVVTNDDAEISDPFALASLQPQSGWAFVNVGTPATSGDRITAVGDAVTGDQLAYDTVGGTVSVAPDLTFSISGATTDFDCELWSADGWGDIGTQYLDVSVDAEIDDSSHDHAAENLTLTSGSVLSIADAAHDHAADNLGLSSLSVLSIADAVHDHAADNLSLNSGAVLTIADAAHDHVADNLGLSSLSVLTIADAAHDHVADNVVLSPGDVLVINNSSHVHAADSPSLMTVSVLSIADAVHDHVTDNVTLSVGQILSIADAAHDHAADNLGLTSASVLSVADSHHAHFADNLVLTTGSVTLDINGTIHLHFADNLRFGKPVNISEIIPYILNSVFDGRVWESATPDDLPRQGNTILPFVVWTHHGGQDAEYVDQTAPSHSNARVQIHVNSPYGSTADTLMKAARDALLASDYTVGVYGSPVGTYDAARKLKGRRQQFSVWFRH